jgi:hypothetical protein
MTFFLKKAKHRPPGRVSILGSGSEFRRVFRVHIKVVVGRRDPLRLPSTSLRFAQGDPSKTSLPSGPHPERGPTARGRGPSRGVGIIDMGLGVQGRRSGHAGWGPGLYPPEVWRVDLP